MRLCMGLGRATPRRLPMPSSCSSTGWASRAGSSGWSRHRAPRHQSRSRPRASSRSSAPAATTMTTITTTDGRTRTPGSRSPTRKSTSPISATRSSPPTPPAKTPTSPIPPPPARGDPALANAAASPANPAARAPDVRERIAKFPADRRRVITSHSAFGYFQDAYGVSFTAPQGVSTEAEASAKDVAAIIAQIKKQKAAAVFLENVTEPRLVEQIARETGAKVGGTLYSHALNADKGDATPYIALIRHNLRQLASALVS